MAAFNVPSAAAAATRLPARPSDRIMTDTQRRGIVPMGTRDYESQRLDFPIDRALIDELLALWKVAFDLDLADEIPQFLGRELHANRDVLFLARRNDRVVATCRLTQSRLDPRLGYLSEVATAPDHRGHGLAGDLCRRAADAFDDAGGHACFLGADNQAAARIYARLGWRRLPNTNVMLRVAPPATPEEFLVDHVRRGLDRELAIRPGGPELRVPIIPAIVTPHDWIALDANAAILSTRSVCQKSCVGLYPRYDRLRQPDGWFALVRDDQAVLGLASAARRDQDLWIVDAFTHVHYSAWLQPLYRRAADLAKRRHPAAVCATCEQDDPLKAAALDRLGFRRTDRTIPLEHDPQILTLRLYEIPT